FLSADAARVDAIAARVRARVELLSNQLVVVVPLGAAKQPKTRDELLGLGRVALADPDTVPAGSYARQWLAPIWAALQPKIVPTLDVRAALAAVETGNASAAVVYKTDARIARKAEIAFE